MIAPEIAPTCTQNVRGVEALLTTGLGVLALYEELMRITSSPVVALNHAAAVAMSEGFERGLNLVESAGSGGSLDNYYLFHASRADLLRRLHRLDEARAAYERALSLTTNHVEQNYIRHRLDELTDAEDVG